MPFVFNGYLLVLCIFVESFQWRTGAQMEVWHPVTKLMDYVEG